MPRPVHARPPTLQPVIQEDRTGCALASVAAVTRQTYRAVKTAAARLGISVDDVRLWSDTRHVRQLLQHFGRGAAEPEPFVAWDALPDVALLAIKWHVTSHGPAWHWVVFARDASGACVLDPKKALRTNRRTDFGRMKPRWFMRVDAGVPEGNRRRGTRGGVSSDSPRRAAAGC